MRDINAQRRVFIYGYNLVTMEKHAPFPYILIQEDM